MSQEKADRQDKTPRDWNSDPSFNLEETQEIKSISLGDFQLLDRQTESSSEDLEFQLSPSRWFHFNCGFGWGLIFGFTALVSASCGIALTKIDAVEKAIAQTFQLNSPLLETEVKTGLNRPIDLLLLEVKPVRGLENELSQEFEGESQTILLLQFRPQENITRVINIPPNNRVKIPGFGWGTMAEAHRYGGVALVSQTIVQTIDGKEIDRYVRATPGTFNRLIASGRITFNDCNLEIDQCSEPQGRVLRQKKAMETIRQRFNIPTYLRSFEITLAKHKSDLDTNLSLPEAISLANFVKELESDNIKVNLVAGYTAGNNNNINNRLNKSKSVSKLPNNFGNRNNLAFKHQPVAVQNTTDSPELGMRVVDYLRSQNFQDVYLVEHIPLRLNKTKITSDRSQLARAKHLKEIMGFGDLEPESNGRQQPLLVRVGTDAFNLPSSNRNF